MEKYICNYCGDEFYPDDENDIYCCEECMDADEAANLEDEENDD